MFMLTVAGVLSILLIIRAVFITETNLTEGVVLGIFGFFSFVTTAIITNGVAP